jgi:hypothetical protein
MGGCSGLPPERLGDYLRDLDALMADFSVTAMFREFVFAAAKLVGERWFDVGQAAGF